MVSSTIGKIETAAARKQMTFPVSWLALFFIWGSQWLLCVAAIFTEPYVSLPWMRPISTIAAVLLSALILIPTLRRERTTGSINNTPLMLVPVFVILVLLIILLVFIRSDFLPTLFIDWLRAVGLSVFYLLLGVRLDRPFAWLGLWLLAACLITTIYYYGFLPIVLESLGGLSLIACGWMLSPYTVRVNKSKV